MKSTVHSFRLTFSREIVPAGNINLWSLAFADPISIPSFSKSNFASISLFPSLSEILIGSF